MSVQLARRTGILTALAATALLATTPGPAAAHGSAGAGMSEQQFEQFETAVLGPEHAAEHARERALERKLRREGRTHTKPRARAAQTVDPAAGGRWDAPFALPALAIHTVMLPTGKLLVFAYPRRPTTYDPAENFTKAYVVDPSNGTSREIPPPTFRDPKTGRRRPANLFCGGTSLLSDGQVLVTGGTLAYNNDKWYYKGLKKAYTFDPWAETWTEQPDMRHGRWYPTQVRMSDGQTMVVAGYDEHDHTDAASGYNKDIELFTQPTRRGGRGRWSLLAEEGGDGAPFLDEPYPHLFDMPSGRVLVAGPHRSADSWYMDEPGPFPTFNWDEAPDMLRDRYYGNAVLLPGTPTGGSTRVMAIGGTDIAKDDKASATAEVFDEGQAAQGWKPAPAWNIARSHANTVELPDGSMVTVGGGLGVNEHLYDFSDEQRQVELYDPAGGQWHFGAAQQEGRAYHSTAVLLPDGRVFSGGDDLNGGNAQDTGEIYSPPYLFKGPRPTITGAPAHAEFGAKASISVSGPAAARAVLVAPGAATHAVDMNQRVVTLTSTTRPDGGLDITMPHDGHIAPPGYYMLFVLDAAGVPSVASWVSVGSAPAPAVARDLANGRTWTSSAAPKRKRGVAAAWRSPARDRVWWQLDLGRPRSVARLALRWGKNPPQHYVVAGSTDGKRFATLGESWPYKAYWQTTTLDAPTKVRYLRVTIRKRTGHHGVALLASRAYGG
jgi:galactose oxidase-like protein/F5/8 type C domain-containing protein